MALAEQFAPMAFDTIDKIRDRYSTMDPNTLQQAISAGGGLSKTLGYDNPEELNGLTPEQFAQVMQNRDAIAKNLFSSIEQAGKIRDMVSGNSEARQAAYGMINPMFNAAVQEGISDKVQSAETQRTQMHLTAEQEIAKLNRQSSENIARMHEAGANSREGARLGLMRQQLALQARKQMAIEALAASDAQRAANYFPASPELYKTYEDTKYKATDKKGIVDRTSWVQAHMKQAALGNQIGSKYNTYGFAEDLGGWPQMVLTPDGWYGINPNKQVRYSNGKVGPEFSKQPIVPMSKDALVQATTKRGSAGKTLVPVYAPSDEED